MSDFHAESAEMSNKRKVRMIPMYDELIKNLRHDSASALQNCEFDFVHDWMLEAADAIESTSKAYQMMAEAYEAEVTKPRWIPVTERLPEENGFYLCLYKHKASGGVAMDEGLSILQWINNKWGINDIYLVTHWMPLPQPPESDGE